MQLTTYAEHMEQRNMNPIKDPDLHTNRHVLPTEHMVNELIMDLSAMTDANYSLEEIINHSIIALEEEETAQDRIFEFSTGATYLHRPNIAPEDPEDKRILSDGWLKFTNKLHQLYTRMHMWDDNGFASYYFDGFTGKDIIIKEKPPLPRG